jgi:serine/threonine-protein kinase
MQLAANVVVAERFRLNRLLGRGGMGSVWHATHLGLDTACALKFIEGDVASHPEAQTRFEREAKAAAMLRSPHVVQILDHGVWQGTPYIAMELLEGEDLGKRLQRLGRMQPAELVPVVHQVCRALTKAHAAGIVHRDLKPDNVFLVLDDDREIAKVLDFGIAKADAHKIDGGTKTGAMLGTPYYMSPEQAQGIKSVDPRSDLWSLAVIVFQCLTGRLPFESEALGDLLVKIIVAPIPSPRDYAPELPDRFVAWWARAAARDPAARFQTAREFAESLSMVFGTSAMTEIMDGGIRSQFGSISGVGSLVAASTSSGSLPAVTHAQAAAIVGAALSESGHRSPGGTIAMGSSGSFSEGIRGASDPMLATHLSHAVGDGAGVPRRRTGFVAGAVVLAAALVVGGVAFITRGEPGSAAAVRPTSAAAPGAGIAGGGTLEPVVAAPPKVEAPAVAAADTPGSTPSAEAAPTPHAATPEAVALRTTASSPSAPHPKRAGERKSTSRPSAAAAPKPKSTTKGSPPDLGF